MAIGMGTVAGRSGVQVRCDCRVNANGALRGLLRVGVNGTLPGESVDYMIDMEQIQ